MLQKAQKTFKSRVVEDVGRSGPQDANSPRFEPHVSPHIPLHLLNEIVMPSVHLDGKTRCRTIEIEDVGSDRMLSAEAKTCKVTAAHAIPEHDFGQGHILP